MPADGVEAAVGRKLRRAVSADEGIEEGDLE
jgi:hypothetical protein